MTRNRKRMIHAAGVLMLAGLAVWIVMLYAERSRLEEAWEKEFLMRYSAVLNDLASDLGHFEEADSFDGRLSCLEAVTNDLMQMKAFMEMHVNLMTTTMPEKMSAGMDPAGWQEAERVVWYISTDGRPHVQKTEASGADGAIPEEEAAAIRLLKEETEKLYRDMTAAEKGGSDDNSILSSAEVYRRLTELLQKVRRQMAP